MFNYFLRLLTLELTGKMTPAVRTALVCLTLLGKDHELDRTGGQGLDS